MRRILAIEPDPSRSVTLRRLVRKRLDAEIIITASTDDAIIVLSETPADVILVSSLASPSDDQLLAAHLRQAPTLSHLPVLTIPPVFDVDVEDEQPGGLLGRLRRKRPAVQVQPAYDFDAIAVRIEEALEQSRVDAQRYTEFGTPVRRPPEPDSPPAAESGPPTALVGLLDTALLDFCGISPPQTRAYRWSRDELTWLSSVKLSWGAELYLVNMSRSGLLVESAVRFTVGNLADFQLSGPANDVVVQGRVVRTGFSADPVGPIHTAAAAFTRPFDFLGPEGSLIELPRTHRNT